MSLSSRLQWSVLLLALVALGPLHAQSRNLAPGFAGLPKGAAMVVMQPDIELFSLSAGGVQEPRADWTETALKHVRAALDGKAAQLGLAVRELTEDQADDLAEINALHAAVASSIALHHLTGGNFALPTKNGKLDWSLEDAVTPIREKTGSDFALFVWMRDSYASTERKITMAAMALLGVGLTGGFQVGYASLVDLRSGRVLWFNRLVRPHGDLREAEAAKETVASLLADFPEVQ